MADPAHTPTALKEDESSSGDGRWRPADAPGALPADPDLASWLVHRGSLTRRLRARGGDRFRLEVIGEGWEPAAAADRRLLETEDPALYVRRVRMSIAGRPLVQACTLAPAATVRSHAWLTGLGPSPLWEALAERDGVARTPFEFIVVDARGHGDRAALHGLETGTDVCWGRRSRFLLGGAPLLVYEFFLPALASLGSG